MGKFRSKVSFIITALIIFLLFYLGIYESMAESSFWLEDIMKWSWSPTHSTILNILIGILHVVLLAILFAIIIITVIIYFIGYALGLLIALVVNILAFIPRDLFGLNFGPFPYGIFGQVVSAIIVILFQFVMVGYFIDTYIITFLERYFINPIIKPIIRFIFKSFSFLLVAFKKTGEERVMIKEDGKIGPINDKVVIPEVFDEHQIEMDLQRYRSDKRLLKNYLSDLASRFDTASQIKVIKKKVEFFNIGKDLFESAYNARMAKAKFDRFAQEQEIEAKKLQIEKKRIEEELNRVDLEEKVKRKELELRLSEIEAQETKLKEGPVKDNSVGTAIHKIKDKSVSIEEAKDEIRKMGKKKGKSEEEIEAMIDEFNRILVEEGILGGD